MKLIYGKICKEVEDESNDDLMKKMRCLKKKLSHIWKIGTIPNVHFFQFQRKHIVNNYTENFPIIDEIDVNFSV